jgi:hypothetical protein
LILSTYSYFPTSYNNKISPATEHQNRKMSDLNATCAWKCCQVRVPTYSALLKRSCGTLPNYFTANSARQSHISMTRTKHGWINSSSGAAASHATTSAATTASISTPRTGQSGTATVENSMDSLVSTMIPMKRIESTPGDAVMYEIPRQWNSFRDKHANSDETDIVWSSYRYLRS